MKGDFSRLTFQRERHYNSVRLQQGRVQLDADWNEAVDILAHLRHTTGADVIGGTGVPRVDGGFAITASGNGAAMLRTNSTSPLVPAGAAASRIPTAMRSWSFPASGGAKMWSAPKFLPTLLPRRATPSRRVDP